MTLGRGLRSAAASTATTTIVIVADALFARKQRHLQARQQRAAARRPACPRRSSERSSRPSNAFWLGSTTYASFSRKSCAAAPRRLTRAAGFLVCCGLCGLGALRVRLRGGGKRALFVLGANP